MRIAHTLIVSSLLFLGAAASADQAELDSNQRYRIASYALFQFGRAECDLSIKLDDEPSIKSDLSDNLVMKRHYDDQYASFQRQHDSGDLTCDGILEVADLWQKSQAR